MYFQLCFGLLWSLGRGSLLQCSQTCTLHYKIFTGFQSLQNAIPSQNVIIQHHSALDIVSLTSFRNIAKAIAKSYCHLHENSKYSLNNELGNQDHLVLTLLISVSFGVSYSKWLKRSIIVKPQLLFLMYRQAAQRGLKNVFLLKLEVYGNYELSSKTFVRLDELQRTDQSHGLYSTSRPSNTETMQKSPKIWKVYLFRYQTVPTSGYLRDL